MIRLNYNNNKKTVILIINMLLLKADNKKLKTKSISNGGVIYGVNKQSNSKVNSYMNPNNI